MCLAISRQKDKETHAIVCTKHCIVGTCMAGMRLFFFFLEMLQVDTDMGMQVQQWWLYCSSQRTSKFATGLSGALLATVKLLARYSTVQTETIVCIPTQRWKKYSNLFINNTL